VLLLAAAAALATTTATTTAPAAAAGRLARLTLPAPTGPYRVGTVSLRLVDDSRRDPWVAAQAYRELMVSVRYPARDTGGWAPAPQMLPGEAAGFDALNNFGTVVPQGKVDWAATRTHAHEGAPVDRRGGPRPVVLYSPGLLDPRSLGTTLCDDLASRGYVVVAIDHTYEVGTVEFPGGRVETSRLPDEFDKAGPSGITALMEKTMAVRVADTRFVLDQLGALTVSARLSDAADLDRIGMFGQSAGGFTALAAMHDDRRIKAAADLDGLLAYVQNDSDSGNLSVVAAEGVDRPVLLMGKEGHDHHTDPSWGALWEHSTGWRREVVLGGAEHATFTDMESMLPQIARQLRLPAKTIADTIGTIRPGRAVTAQRVALAALFDGWLRGQDSALARQPGR
jgi:predicted dienelactone hydrolase